MATELNATELAQKIEEVARRVSYHNATDDARCYERETPQRVAAEHELKALTDEALARGVYVNLRNHLVGFDLVKKFEAIRPADAPTPDGKAFNDIVAKVAGVPLP